MANWRPISTVPHDEAVFVNGGEIAYPLVASWSGLSDEPFVIDIGGNSGDEIGWPEYWMPLDALPPLPLLPATSA